MRDDVTSGGEDEDETAWDSGPFCRHWYDPESCERDCKVCGHRCGKHDDMLRCFHETENGEQCPCPGYEEPD
jgi:hypothetical protein